MGYGGALAAPVTAYLYDWNMLPLGQLLWEKELVLQEFPPMQAPETYNLNGILKAMQRKATHGQSIDRWRVARIDDSRAAQKGRPLPRSPPHL